MDAGKAPAGKVDTRDLTAKDPVANQWPGTRLPESKLPGNLLHRGKGLLVTEPPVTVAAATVAAEVGTESR